MTLKTNRDLTKEIVSPKKFIPDVISKHFTREQAQAKLFMQKNSNPLDKIENFDFTDLKVEEKITYEYYHCGANKKIMDIITKSDNSLKTLRLIKNDSRSQNPGTDCSKLIVSWTRKCEFPANRTIEGEMSWQQSVLNYHSEATRITMGLLWLQKTGSVLEGGAKQTKTGNVSST